MMTNWSIVLASLLITTCFAVNDPPTPELYLYRMNVDHFNFAGPYGDSFFNIRVLVDQSSYSRKGPILYYTGNEGDIEMFYKNTGFMFDAAKELGALIVFGEHRYYGKSLPFGDDSFHLDKVGFLSSEQALADHAEIAEWARTKFASNNPPIIAVGGSYGGMLAAWSRIKYPSTFVGAIAASAPVLQFPGLVDPEVWSTIATQDFAQAVPLCDTQIRAAYGKIDELFGTEVGRTEIATALKTCSPLQADEKETLIGFLTDALTFLAVCDYPYPSSFLQPLPAWPVKVACELVVKESNVLNAMYQAINVYYNTSGESKCFNISGGASPGLGDAAWDYQACTEMLLPIGSDGVHDMFLPAPWDIDAISAACKAQWGVTPRPSWPVLQWGGSHLSAASNIVFSNGALDPWKSGGVLHSISDSVIAIVIEHGAHHLDLRSKNPADPNSVIEARTLEMKHIQKWMEEWNQQQ